MRRAFPRRAGETRAPRPQSGFSLLEVLIALVILSVGLLGLAVLQAEGLRGTSSAFQRHRAIQLASDLADRMRANRAGLDGYLLAPQDFQCADREESGSSVAASNCANPEEMARHDLFEWNTNLAAGGYTGTVTAVPGASDQFVISVGWSDRTVGSEQQQYQATVQF